MCVRVRVCVHVCVYVCGFARVACAFVRACVRACLYMRARGCTCIDVYGLVACVWVCLFAGRGGEVDRHTNGKGYKKPMVS